MDYRLATLDKVDIIRQQLSSCRRVAIDTEFHAERRYLPRLFLVQLTVDGGDTWVLDPLVDGLLEAVSASLLGTVWVLHAGLTDLRLLDRALGGLPEHICDTQLAAGLIEPMWPSSLANLFRDHLDRDLPKTATLSDWSQRPLSDAQLRYAVDDVAELLPLWDRLAARAEQLGRRALLADACADLLARGGGLPPTDEAWRRIRGTNVLRPREAAVLQELCSWREELARELDCPPHSVLGDGRVLELARKRPLTVGTLFKNRRFPKAVVKRHGATLVELIERAWARPEWAWPHPVRRYTASTRRQLLLTLFAETDGRDHRYGPRLGLPERLRDDLAVAWPTSREDLAELLGWRDALNGDRLWALCSGGAALAMGNSDVAIVAKSLHDQP